MLIYWRTEIFSTHRWDFIWKHHQKEASRTYVRYVKPTPIRTFFFIKFKNFISKTLSRSTFFVFFFLTLLNAAYAQVNCGGQTVTGCLKFPSQTYQCIDGDVTAPSLYGTKLLPPTQAQTTSQFLIVKGKITFPEDYTFASGSDVVFLDNNSDFRVAQNSAVAPKLRMEGQQDTRMDRVYTSQNLQIVSLIVTKQITQMTEYSSQDFAIILIWVKTDSIFMREV